MISLKDELLCQYEEFLITLLRDTSGTYKLNIKCPAGEIPQIDYRPPFGPMELEEAFASISTSSDQLTRGSLYEATDIIKRLGASLFTSLASNQITNLYQRSRAEAKDSGKSLRLRIVLDDLETALLPWEFIFDPLRKDFMCLSSRSPIVRQWGVETRPTPKPVSHPLRILIAAAEVNAPGMEGTDDEIDAIRAEFEKCDLPSEVEVLQQATPKSLLNKLEGNAYHILHFMFSGVRWEANYPFNMRNFHPRAISQQSLSLAGTNDDNKSPARPLEAKRLISLYSARGENLQLLFLSGDCTDWLACQLTEVAEATVGWRGVNSVRSYHNFTKGFYSNFLRGQSLEAAVTQGRKNIDANDPGGKEWGMPVFYMQTAESILLTKDKDYDDPTARKSPRKAAKSKRLQKTPAVQREYDVVQALLETARESYRALEAESNKSEMTPDFVERQRMVIKDKIGRLEEKLRQLGKS